VITFTGHLDVALPPDAMFVRLADMAELDRWNPNVTASRRTNGDRLVVGSTYLRSDGGPLRMTARSTVTEVEPGRSVTYEGSISGLWSIDTLTFEPRGEAGPESAGSKSGGPAAAQRPVTRNRTWWRMTEDPRSRRGFAQHARRDLNPQPPDP
jgi:hypothetical protein